MLAPVAAELPADVFTAADADADDDDDDVVVGVAKLIRSDEMAGVGMVRRVLLAAAAGRDAVLPEFTVVRDREPAADDGDVTSANVSDSMLVEMSPAAAGKALLPLDRGPVIQHTRQYIIHTQ